MRLPTVLPELRGRWLTAYRIAWFAMLALAVVGMSAGQWSSLRKTSEWDMAIYGAGLRHDVVSGKHAFSPIGSEPAQVGIRPSSIILAIDGKTAPQGNGMLAFWEISRALAGPDGRRLRLTMQSPDGSVGEHVVVRGPHHLAEADAKAPVTYQNRRHMRVAIHLILAIPMLIAAVLLYRRRRRDPVVALLSLGFLGMLARGVGDLLPVASGESVSSTINSLGFGALFLAILTFPNGRFEPRWSLLALPFLAALVSARWWATGSEQAAMMLVGVPLILLTLGAVARRFYQLPAGPERQQVKWAALGFIAFLLLGLSTIPLQLVDQSVTDDGTHFLLMTVSSVIAAFSWISLIAGLLISLLRYRLYDAEAAISRSAVYATLTVTLIAIFAATEKFVESLGERYFEGQIGAAAGAIAAGVAAVMIAPLHHRMSGWAERRFQRNLIRLKRGLPALVADLRTTATPDALAAATVERVVTGVRASRCALVMSSNGKVLSATGIETERLQQWLSQWQSAVRTDALDCRREDPMFPLRVPLEGDGTGLAGWLLLGPRPDGSFYGKDEREVLLEIADPVARGLSVALQRDNQARAIKKETASLSSRLKALEKTIAQLVSGVAAKPA